MMLAHPHMDTVLDFLSDRFNTLVIENPMFFRRFLQDIHCQIQGDDGVAVLSENNMPISFSRNAELLADYISFEVSRKSLVNKILVYMESVAMDEAHYVKTMQLMGELEQYIHQLAFDLPCSIFCGKMHIGGVLRSAGIEIANDYDNDLERILDYMELTRELERDKLFVLVNLRSFYPDAEVSAFCTSALNHGFSVLLVDSVSRKLLPNEKRVTVDSDLCEF